MSAYAENLLRHLVRAGHDVTLVSQYRGDEAGRAVYGGGPPPPERVPDGVEVHALEAHGEQAVVRGEPADFEADVDTMTATVLHLHAARPFDVPYAQYAYPNGMAVLRAARKAGLPAVVSVQGGDGHWVGTCCDTHRDLVRAVFTHAPALLIGSPSFAAEVAERHGLDPTRFTLVPGATDAERFTPGERAATAQVSDPAVLLYHGRVDARKGVLDLLEVVRLLLAAGERVRLLISGIGPDSALVARRVTELALDGHVEVLGAVPYERAHEVYRRGEVFVSPTYAEGFSNTILEAMATGLPVVSTDVVGVRDCVRPGENGVLVPPADPPALAAGSAACSPTSVCAGGSSSGRTATCTCAGRGRWWPGGSPTCTPGCSTPHRTCRSCPIHPSIRPAGSARPLTCCESGRGVPAPRRRRLLGGRHARRAGGGGLARSGRHLFHGQRRRPVAVRAVHADGQRAAHRRRLHGAAPGRRRSRRRVVGRRAGAPAAARGAARGYASAAELFAGVRPDDGIGGPLRAALVPHVADADLVLAPQAIGDHVDHRVVADAVAAVADDVLWWRDTPYVLRQPHVPATQDAEHAVSVGVHLDIKIDAARCYVSQLGFQFGGAERVGPLLRELAEAEGSRLRAGVPCEAFSRR